MIFLVVLLLFGAKRLPEIGSSLGKGIREFKGSIREIEKEVKAVDEPERDAVSPSAASPEPDEEPRRLTTTQGPDSAVTHPGGVPAPDDPVEEGSGEIGLEDAGAEGPESEEEKVPTE